VGQGLRIKSRVGIRAEFGRRVRAPHKPPLWLFGRFAATGSTVAAYADAEEPQVLLAKARLQARIRALPGCEHVPITDHPALVADAPLQGSGRLVGQAAQRCSQASTPPTDCGGCPVAAVTYRTAMPRPGTAARRAGCGMPSDVIHGPSSTTGSMMMA
jgi:hypothetical protein